MKCPHYSVLSSVYINEKPEYLRKSIESMVSQSVQTNDYIIVKDGPITPELQKVLDEYTDRYPYIRVFSYEKNRGLGYALNFGISKCKNELIARMDTDDIALPNRCQRQLFEFMSNPALDIVGTSIYEFKDNEDDIITVKNMPESAEDIRNYARRRNPFNHPTVMYKKKSVINCGGYIEGQRGEDFALFTKMVFEGCITRNINEKLFLYRADESQFKRRSSYMDSKVVITIAKRNLRSKYISISDYCFIVISQYVGMLLPVSIGTKIFRKIFRDSFELD